MSVCSGVYLFVVGIVVEQIYMQIVCYFTYTYIYIPYSQLRCITTLPSPQPLSLHLQTDLESGWAISRSNPPDCSAVVAIIQRWAGSRYACLGWAGDICVHSLMSVCIYIHIYIDMYTYIYVYSSKCVYISIYICGKRCICILMYLWFSCHLRWSCR